MTPAQEKFARAALRRASFKWKPRRIAYELAQTDEGEYTIKKEKDRSRIKFKCNHCGGIFRSKEINMDHIEPVVCPKLGFYSFDEYIQRLLCAVEGWQCLCKSCHDKKTAKENGERRGNT